jgi:hypothetical protein
MGRMEGMVVVGGSGVVVGGGEHAVLLRSLIWLYTSDDVLAYHA